MQISTHTLRGERDTNLFNSEFANVISTHTLRGERDNSFYTIFLNFFWFQLTRSVGSVTKRQQKQKRWLNISTHTLRGERDEM